MAETKLSYNRAVTSKLMLKASQLSQLLKNPPISAGDTKDVGSTAGLIRLPRVGNGKPFQYCLENSKDKGGWQVTGRGVPKSQTRRSD